MTRSKTVATTPPRIPRSRLAIAISGGLLALSVFPAAAANTSDAPRSTADVRVSISEVFDRAVRINDSDDSSAPASSGFTDGFSARWRQDAGPTTWSSGARAPLAATYAADLPTAPTTAASWETEEFKADWGLDLINAQHAYARGLSGAGIRLGLTDSGVAFGHGEFAGKDMRSLAMAEVLTDGSWCSQSGMLGGPDACFYTEGDDVQVQGLRLGQDLLDLFSDGEEMAHCLELCFDYQAHGTHVAGTIAGNRDGIGMHGVAWGASLSSATLFGDTFASVPDIYCLLLGIGDNCFQQGLGAPTSAFETMYEQAIAQDVRAMNHSWGWNVEFRTNEEMIELMGLLEEGAPEIFDPMAIMADAARRSGMIQVVAAGNNLATFEGMERQPVAALPASAPYLFPDVEKYWVSVINLTQDGTLSEVSMRCGFTAQWCIGAPGTDITSSIVTGEPTGGRRIVETNGNVRFEFDARVGENAILEYSDLTGTSMAAPHVTGALGLLFERFPYLEGHQVRDVMLTTATDLGEEGVDDVYGWGLLNLEKAIDGYGQLRVDTDVVMDWRAGGRKVWDGDAWDVWSNDIGGPGRLGFHSNVGGWLRLDGDNSFNGASVTGGTLEMRGRNTLTDNVVVSGGRLLIDAQGSLVDSALIVQGAADGTTGGVAIVNGTVTGASTRVEARGLLGGSGTLGDTWVAGTIAPGNSIGTLTIDGDYIQTAGATLVAELQPPDQADLLEVTGSATLLGGTLLAHQLPGTFLLGQEYRILSAAGGITGTFDTVDTGALSPFLSLSMLYGANALDVGVVRGAALASAARSDNQWAVANAVDALPDNQGLLVPITLLSAADAPRAFDQLSGEVHASAQQVLLDSGRLVRDAALARAAAGSDAFGRQRDPEANNGAWVEVHRQGGHIADDGNAARTQHNGSAALVGIDRQFDGGWRMGVFGGVGSTDFDVRNRDSKGEADTRHVGIYGSQTWNGFGIRAGYTHAWHELDIHRDVNFSGFVDGVHGRYDADGWQAFAEVGYRFEAGNWEIEPYLQYAHVELDTDGFIEDGGAAALRGRDANARVDLGTAGVRVAVNLSGSSQEQSWLSLRGNLGYRHAGGNQAQTTQLSFDSTQWYGVRSPVIRDEAMLVELGLAARTTANSMLEFGYSGALSDHARDHGANARFSLQF